MAYIVNHTQIQDTVNKAVQLLIENTVKDHDKEIEDISKKIKATVIANLAEMSIQISKAYNPNIDRDQVFIVIRDKEKGGAL